MGRTFARAYVFGAGHNPDDTKRLFQAANEGSMVQTSDAGAADNELLVEMLAAQTLRAQALGSLLAKKPEIDFLLRLSGTTQISEAIKRRGAPKDGPFLLVVAGSADPKGGGGGDTKRLPRRELTRKELGRVEKAALLGTKRL